MLAVIAVGGNALITDPDRISVESEIEAVQVICAQIADMIEAGWDVIIGHGNGPQIGFNLRRSELAAHELFEIPLDVCGTFTQGSIGYYIQQSLQNVFHQRGIQKHVVTVITQVEIDEDDPAFDEPTKPIGMFMTAAEAERVAEKGWHVIEDSGRGWRRVVASPQPKSIVELPVIKQLLADGVIVIAIGGGGIPVVRNEAGMLRGVRNVRKSVVDKDLAAALLANQIDADLLLISTGVEQVAINFNRPDVKWLGELTAAEAKKYMAEGHFAPGSMLPKIQASLNYLEDDGATVSDRRVIITDQDSIGQALAGETGTRITK
ncbi:MAG: carbamate kinase [Candidatus Promineifilaceae bacterium]|jgi:carbamate kinase